MPTSKELARQLVATGTLAQSTLDPARASVRICEQLYRGLSRWIGAEGSHALFARALTRAQANHAALRSVRLQKTVDSCLEGIEESAQVHGATQTVAGLESFLENLIELLGRLIGDDVAAKLIDHSLGSVTESDEPRTGSRTNEP